MTPAMRTSMHRIPTVEARVKAEAPLALAALSTEIPASASLIPDIRIILENALDVCLLIEVTLALTLPFWLGCLLVEARVELRPWIDIRWVWWGYEGLHSILHWRSIVRNEYRLRGLQLLLRQELVKLLARFFALALALTFLLD